MINLENQLKIYHEYQVFVFGKIINNNKKLASIEKQLYEKKNN